MARSGGSIVPDGITTTQLLVKYPVLYTKKEPVTESPALERGLSLLLAAEEGNAQETKSQERQAGRLRRRDGATGQVVRDSRDPRAAGRVRKNHRLDVKWISANRPASN